MRNSFRFGKRTAAVWVAVLSLAFPAAIAAHDIPLSVAILAYVKPEGQRLRLVVRVPLEAMRDIEWPLRGPGYLELSKVDTLLRDAAETWIASDVRLFEGDAPLGDARLVGARVSLPSDRSFERFESAAANVTGPPLAPTIDIARQQAMLDVMFEYNIASDTSRFSIDPTLARLGVRTTTILHFLPAGGAERVFQYSGNPGLVRLDPRWHQAALQFVDRGFKHILDGFDHLLFVICLVIPFRRLRPLIGIVTSFTAAHSITLFASAFGFVPSALWFPPLIEVLIAVSIVYMAFENIVGAKIRTRWMLAFGFGLVHGFGFSFALKESLQFAGSHLLTSLFSFNVGVEFGQVFVLLLAVPLLNFAFKHMVAERMGTIILSALVAHTAWHWMLDRGAALAQYQFQPPVIDAAFMASVLRGAMAVLIIGGALWAVNTFVLKRRQLFGATDVATTKDT